MKYKDLGKIVFDQSCEEHWNIGAEWAHKFYTPYNGEFWWLHDAIEWAADTVQGDINRSNGPETLQDLVGYLTEYANEYNGQFSKFCEISL